MNDKLDAAITEGVLDELSRMREPTKATVAGEIQREPYRIKLGTVEIAGFDEEHSLQDIARWIGKADAEELARILIELAAGEQT